MRQIQSSSLHERYKLLCEQLIKDETGTSLLEDFILKACDYVAATVLDNNSAQARIAVISSLQALNSHIELTNPELTLFSEDVFYTNIDSGIIELINSIFINRAR